MKNLRPKNLNLFTIRFPIPAIVSILHRISGVILFLLIPFMLWGLYLSLASLNSFSDLQDFFNTPFMKFIVWGTLSALAYHIVAGIRHVLMDMGVNDEPKKESRFESIVTRLIGKNVKYGRLSAIISMVLAVVLILMIGVWIW